MFHKILVALDSSEIRQEVFAKALDIAKANQASLMLVHVLSFDDPNSPKMPVGGNEALPITSEAKAFGEFYKQWQIYEQKQQQFLQSQQEQAIALGLKTKVTLSNGLPGRIICDLAHNWQADLIVLGRRRRSRLKELVLGSVSTYVTHHSPCSVLIVQ
jgi:nucleotide-binding universal stress UspA family protein